MNISPNDRTDYANDGQEKKSLFLYVNWLNRL